MTVADLFYDGCGEDPERTIFVHNDHPTVTMRDVTLQKEGEADKVFLGDLAPGETFVIRGRVEP